MKNYLTMLTAIFFAVHIATAQVPQYIPWQAVVRDTSWNPLTSHSVSFRFTIHTGSSTGTTVYQETQSATTNQLGMVNLQIGSGTVDSGSGTFSSINWSSGSEYLQVELDPTGGSSYATMGAPQMMSVPYALYAGNSDAPPVTNSAWGLSGNSGTTPGVEYLGTNDETPLYLAVNGIPIFALTLPSSPNLGSGIYTQDSAGDALFTAFTDFYGGTFLNAALGDFDQNFNSTHIGIKDGNSMIELRTDSIVKIAPGSGSSVPIAQFNENSNNIFLNANTEIGTTNAAGATLRVDGTLNFTTGNQGLGFVLTSDASGNADWASIANSAWGLTGNSGTNPLTNFIGSTDGAQVNLQEDQDSIGIDLFTTGSSPSLVRNINAVGDVFTVQNRYGFQPFAVSIAGGLGDTLVSITGANFQYQDAAGTYLNGAGQVLTSDASGNASWQLPFSTGIVASSGAPTIAAGTGAGTSPSVSVSGTNIGGLVTVTPGSSPGASSTLVTVTYNSLTYPNNSYVILYPANAATAVLHGAAAVFASGSTGNFIIGTGSTALAPSVAYAWNYVVVGN